MYELVMGSKCYSSWSVRPWLAMKVAGIPFTETVIPLDRPDTRAMILAHAPSGRVPALKDGGLTIWDSLAIVEYLNERRPDAGLWPADREDRARARAIGAEMHSGFAALRNQYPMNLRRMPQALAISGEAKAEATRIEDIWAARGPDANPAGPFLFGAFCAADAMFAPVVNRFHIYGFPVADATRVYMRAVMALPAWAELEEAARGEPTIAKYEREGRGDDDQIG